MASSAVFFVGAILLVLMLLSARLLMRDMKWEEALTRRVKIIHGEAPGGLAAPDPAAVLDGAKKAIATVGQVILRTGLISPRTRDELEKTLAASALRGPQGVGIFIGCKLLLLVALPFVAWLMVRGGDWPEIMGMIIPAGAGVFGLLLPDWLVHRYRKGYLDRLENGLPDALDMMVICAQAGMGLGPIVIRVAEELGVAYREIAFEFATTASELQVLSDSRIALDNMGLRTELDSFKRLAMALIQTVQYGTPLSDALRGLSAEMRQEMLTRYETKAARLPVLLTMPTIVFILPCVFLIAGGPAIIQVMKAFAN